MSSVNIYLPERRQRVQFWEAPPPRASGAELNGERARREPRSFPQVPLFKEARPRLETCQVGKHKCFGLVNRHASTECHPQPPRVNDKAVGPLWTLPRPVRLGGVARGLLFSQLAGAEAPLSPLPFPQSSLTRTPSGPA